jgi:hypothetical protein
MILVFSVILQHISALGTAVGGVILLVHRQVEQFGEMVRDHDLWIRFMARHVCVQKRRSKGTVCVCCSVLVCSEEVVERRESDFCVRAPVDVRGTAGVVAKALFSGADWVAAT